MLHLFKKMYVCSVCGRLEAPFLYDKDIKKNYGWNKVNRKWFCRSCNLDMPKTKRELVARIKGNEHHNLAVKSQLLKGKYKKKYKKIFAKAYV